MAEPAEIANDMAAHAAYWDRRDQRIQRLCRDTCALIRSMLEGKRVGGRTYYDVWRRLLYQERRFYTERVRGFPDFSRARGCIERLKSDAIKEPSNGQ